MNFVSELSLFPKISVRDVQTFKQLHKKTNPEHSLPQAFQQKVIDTLCYSIGNKVQRTGTLLRSSKQEWSGRGSAWVVLHQTLGCKRPCFGIAGLGKETLD